MKRFFKSLSATLTAACVFVFSAVVYGQGYMPDNIDVLYAPRGLADGFFSVDNGYAVKASSFTSSDSGHKATLMAFDVIPVKPVTLNVTKRRYVNVSGEVFGIKLYTKGVMVVKIDSLNAVTGGQSPAQLAGIRCGDCITHADGSVLIGADDFIAAVNSSGGKELALTVERGGEKLDVKLQPYLSESGKYRAGIWVRDSSAGIGTLTFCDNSSGIFAGLGHGVCDVDTGKLMPLSGGEAVKATVNGFYKSSPGDPGELCGVFSQQVIGPLKTNSAAGVYGIMNSESEAKLMPVALESEVKEGYAQIIATVDGNGPQYYDAQITKIYPASGNEERNLIVKITDEELLAKTGGILQGMSGSPIIQDSMLVGAVTHVFVNDPAQGYGIFAQRMVEAADALSNAAQQEAA